MRKATFALVFLIVPLGCFPWGGNSLRTHPDGCPGCAACAGKNGAGNCAGSESGQIVSPEEITPANARSKAQALEAELDREAAGASAAGSPAAKGTPSPRR